MNREAPGPDPLELSDSPPSDKVRSVLLNEGEAPGPDLLDLSDLLPVDKVCSSDPEVEASGELFGEVSGEDERELCSSNSDSFKICSALIKIASEALSLSCFAFSSDTLFFHLSSAWHSFWGVTEIIYFLLFKGMYNITNTLSYIKQKSVPLLDFFDEFLFTGVVRWVPVTNIQ